MVVHAKRGDRVEEGERLAEIHARTDAGAAAGAAEVLGAYELGPEPPGERPVLLEVVR